MNILHSFLTPFLSQRDRWVLWAPVPVAFGIAAYFSLPGPPPLYAGAVLAALALCALPSLRRDPRAVRVWVCLFLCVLGFAAAQFRTWHIAAPVLLKKTGVLEITGRVADADAMGKAWRVVLDDLSFDAPPQARMPERVRVKLKNSDAVAPRAGDIIKVKALLRPVPGPVAPDAFDFRRHAYFQRIGATGFAVSAAEVVSRRESGFFFETLRASVREKIRAAHDAPANVEGLAIAFMVGDSGEISAADWETARASGIAHLIAISGSHFVMVVGAAFFAVRALLAAIPYVALRWPVKKIAALAGMFAAVFYLLLIGAPVPAQRATVMSCAVMLAIMLDRDPLTLRLAAFAALLVLFFAPESLMGPSFQLSFAAVIALIAFFESVQEKWTGTYRASGLFGRAGLFLLGCFLMTWIAQAATMPFALHHFLKVPFVAGLVANMVAVPLSSFVTFPAGLLSCLLMPFGLERGPLWVTEESIALIMRVAETVAGWPLAAVEVDAWPAAWLGAVSLGGLWLCLWRGRLRALGLLPVALALVILPSRPRPDILVAGEFRLIAAVRGEGGRLLLSPGRADKFIREAWTEREGGKGTAAWPAEACNTRICTFRVKGKTVVFNLQSDFRPRPGEEIDEAAAAGDCNAAALLILPKARRPRGSCTAAIIDKWDLYDDGAHAVYIEDGVKIVSVTDMHGLWPWAGRGYGKVK